MAVTSDRRGNGCIEGVSRAISQACVFCLDAQKTRLQIYDKGCAPKVNWMHLIGNGMFTSIVTSGVVFGSYYSIYNSIGPSNLWAGPCAALATSTIKIPISNCMRVMQSGLAKNPLQAGMKIYQSHKFRGLYTGYGISLLEDIIELDTRTRLYQMMRDHLRVANAGAQEKECAVSAFISGATLGSISGVATSFLTSPFDCVKSHMAVSAVGVNKSAWNIAKHILKKEGPRGFYRGAVLRTSSSALKSALFFMFVEALQV